MRPMDTIQNLVQEKQWGVRHRLRQAGAAGRLLREAEVAEDTLDEFLLELNWVHKDLLFKRIKHHQNELLRKSRESSLETQRLLG